MGTALNRRRTTMNRVPRSKRLAMAAVLALALLAPVAASAATSPRTTTIRYETPVLRVEVTGKGRPMVLIPGLTCSGDVWRETVAHFADHYQCHVVTLGGF